jgi:GNAT superfamily N-acetyltransferase
MGHARANARCLCLMDETITISQARISETDSVTSILREAADWLEERGIPMWHAEELDREQTAAAVAAGYFFLARCGGEAVGTVKFQLQDALFWPDTPTDEAAYVHRLAVRRAFAGGRLSALLLDWAAERAVSAGKRFLRLDCEAARPRLRAVYERRGFQHHSDRQVGPFFVSRYQLPLSSSSTIVCPVCGAATVQEKCKVICRSDTCRGRVIYNCAEF